MSVTALSDHARSVLEVFAEVALTRPSRTAGALQCLRVARYCQLAPPLDDPAFVGRHAFSRVIFGEQHPWGYPGEGTVKSVKSITQKDLVAWHKAWFRPANAALFVVGDTDAAALQPLLQSRFGGWKDSPPPKVAKYSHPKAGTRVVTLVDKPDAPQ
jgi:predicted Zn-dependent peptidase